jgi:hypothetical protein
VPDVTQREPFGPFPSSTTSAVTKGNMDTMSRGGRRTMDVEQFVEWLQTRTREDIDWMLVALDRSVETAGGTVGRMRAHHEVEAALRRQGTMRHGCRAAHRATEAALAACEATGVAAADRSAATRLARAAGDAALGLVAGGSSAGAETLLRPFLGATVLSAS